MPLCWKSIFVNLLNPLANLILFKKSHLDTSNVVKLAKVLASNSVNLLLDTPAIFNVVKLAQPVKSSLDR